MLGWKKRNKQRKVEIGRLPGREKEERDTEEYNMSTQVFTGSPPHNYFQGLASYNWATISPGISC